MGRFISKIPLDPPGQPDGTKIERGRACYSGNSISCMVATFH